MDTWPIKRFETKDKRLKTGKAGFIGLNRTLKEQHGLRSIDDEAKKVYILYAGLTIRVKQHLSINCLLFIHSTIIIFIKARILW